MSLRRYALIFLFGLSLYAQSHAIAFVDVTVVPMDSDRLLAHSTVVVADGQIAAVGSARKIRIPKGAEKIDGHGKFLMPGLADMHVHLNARAAPQALLPNEDFATLFLANGVTTVRNMWGNPDVLAFRKAIDEGKIVGPHIYTTGPITDGNPPSGPLMRVVETAKQADDAVADDKQDGYDGVKVYNHLSPEAYDAIVATARRVGLPVYGHVPDKVGIEKVLEARQDSIEHVYGYLDALDRDPSPGKMAELVSKTVRAGTWNCVTLVFYQGAVPPSEGARLEARPSMRYLPEALLASWTGNRQLASLTPDQFSRIRLYNEKRNDVVRALHRGGAKILVGTDTPNAYVVPGFAVHEELRNLVNLGFTPYEALRAATSDAAEFMHSQNQWGTVRIGARADLILVEANPLENIANVSRIAGVAVAGRWIPETELKASLDRLAASYTRQ
jgi:imidazolonepropionase-like amidohydrolase